MKLQLITPLDISKIKNKTKHLISPKLFFFFFRIIEPENGKVKTSPTVV